ncbi:MAG: tetratricopeptide repeat protein [Planctomycetota bacterium]|jgi:tetratricopeptide (TPR) repeat protein
MKLQGDKVKVFCAYAALALGTIIAYEPIRHNDFVNYDDDKYVTENPWVRAGITRESVVWSFTGTHGVTWHPLTSLSHMLDCELFGLNPFWHHLVSFLIHLANALLLLWVLKKMTGAIWCSAFVAAAFAVHPLRVESVAWVSERKDVLSAFFWMLTMAAYAQYTARPSIKRYLLVVLAFCLGLMAKPMLVTLPFVLLLLDYWPLRRFQWARQNQIQKLPEEESARFTCQTSGTWSLIAEKIPLFIMSVTVSLITYVAQQSGDAVVSTKALPIAARMVNALTSYATYIAKMIYPARLAVLYPYPTDLRMDAAALLVLAVLIAVVRWGRGRAWLTVGLLWYLGTLVPVIGLVQVGGQAMADRYTYLPSIGILIMVAWGTAEFVSKWRLSKIVPAVAACTVLVTWSMLTRVQVRYWQNSLTLCEHTLAVTKDNPLMYYNYGLALYEHGESLSDRRQFSEANRYYEDAVEKYKKAIELRPKHLEAHINLGVVLAKQQKYAEAVTYLNEALQINPNCPPHVYYNLGSAYALQGRYDLAIQNYNEALRLEPGRLDTRKSLAEALARRGDIEKAIYRLKESLRLQPNQPELHKALAKMLLKQNKIDEAVTHYEHSIRFNTEQPDVLYDLGRLYFRKGKIREAFACCEEALRLNPENVDVMNTLAWHKATQGDTNFRDPNEAVRLAVRACELTNYRQPEVLDTLAAAYATMDRFPRAIETAEKAAQLAEAGGKTSLAREIRRRLQLYRAGRPCRQK